MRYSVRKVNLCAASTYLRSQETCWNLPTRLYPFRSSTFSRLPWQSEAPWWLPTWTLPGPRFSVPSLLDEQSTGPGLLCVTTSGIYRWYTTLISQYLLLKCPRLKRLVSKYYSKHWHLSDLFLYQHICVKWHITADNHAWSYPGSQRP